jgi:prepilin-type processing-associated H-X9-DG protein
MEPRPLRMRVHLLIALGLCLGVLVVLLMPLVRLSGMRSKDEVGNALKQITVSMIAYSYDHQNRLPALHAPGMRVPSAFYRQESLGAFALLVQWSGGDIPAKLFWPRRMGVEPPTVTPRANGSGWLDQPAVFAYDWSSRGGTLWPNRPLVAVRDPHVYEGEGINVAFGDGHYEFIRSVPGHAETPPVRESDPPLPWSVPHIGDDLFTSAGDGPGMDVVGGGSATRCFVK